MTYDILLRRYLNKSALQIILGRILSRHFLYSDCLFFFADSRLLVVTARLSVELALQGVTHYSFLLSMSILYSVLHTRILFTCLSLFSNTTQQ